jgi:hypothetical protein
MQDRRTTPGSPAKRNTQMDSKNKVRTLKFHKETVRNLSLTEAELRDVGGGVYELAAAGTTDCTNDSMRTRICPACC